MDIPNTHTGLSQEEFLQIASSFIGKPARLRDSYNEYRCTLYAVAFGADSCVRLTFHTLERRRRFKNSTFVFVAHMCEVSLNKYTLISFACGRSALYLALAPTVNHIYLNYPES